MDFFAELQRLREKTPVPGIMTTRSENCDYSPYHANGRNCYRIIGHNLCEDCFYGLWLGDSRDCADCDFTEKCELCYECVDCRESYNLNFCQDCINCSDCEYSYDCKGVQNCYGCVNLRNKQFHIFNQPYSKEAYFEKVKSLRRSYEHNAPPEFIKLEESLPHNYFQGFQNENAIGDHIFHSKNAFYCFDANELEDSMYIFNGYRIKDVVDCNYTGQGSEMNYMCHSAVTLFNSNFCSICWYCQNLEYCEYVFNSHDCFGCVGRNHAEYEILNKKYSKEEYFKELARIKAELKSDGSYGKWWWPSPYENAA